MKKLVYAVIAICTISNCLAQEETGEEQKKDTTRLNIGTVEVLLINHPDKNEPIDTVDASPSEEEVKRNEAHWAGFDLGVNMLLNNQNIPVFNDNPYWENDPAKSFNIGLNLMERKFSIYKNYIGITTGLGFNFTQYAFKNNYVLVNTVDSIYAEIDTVYQYTKNKLRASYLQIPLLLEFNTNADGEKGFYLAAGVVGGVRLSSRTKKLGTVGGKDFEQITKGTYALNPFKLDATVRVGYMSWGAFATYSMIPLFESGKTVDVHPFTVGLTHNF